MSKLVTYNLPPYVTLINNPHFNGYVGAVPNQVMRSQIPISLMSNDTTVDRRHVLYAPYKLKSLGNYPKGKYTVVVPGNSSYSGTFRAVATTNTSVTLAYPKLGNVPYSVKRSDNYMDVNSYSFAYKSYPKSQNPGGFAPFEKYYDPLVYDFDANGWHNSTSFIQHHIIKHVYFRGKITNSYTYGHDIVYLPELPFNGLNDISDPTELDLVPISERTALKGRYFIFIKKMPNSNQIECEIFPELPKNKNVEIWIEEIEGSEIYPINGSNRGSGAKINILYDGFFWTKSGVDSGLVLPAIKNRSNNTEPALITLPEGSDYGAFRYYSGRKRIKDFDLYRTLNIPPVGTVIENAIPCNILI